MRGVANQIRFDYYENAKGLDATAYDQLARSVQPVWDQVCNGLNNRIRVVVGMALGMALGWSLW